jgi:hypothetical protein
MAPNTAPDPAMKPVARFLAGAVLVLSAAWIIWFVLRHLRRLYPSPTPSGYSFGRHLNFGFGKIYDPWSDVFALVCALTALAWAVRLACTAKKKDVAGAVGASMLALLAFGVIGGCANAEGAAQKNQQDHPKIEGREAKLTESQVQKIIREYTARKKLDLKHYMDPKASLTVLGERLVWRVPFDQKDGVFGGDFTLFIDDETQKTSVFGGM